jgi:hypothetical protein
MHTMIRDTLLDVLRGTSMGGLGERMIEPDDQLLRRLRALEIELQSRIARGRAGLDDWLHPAFVEIGRAGTRRARADLLAHGPALPPADATCDGFSLEVLQTGTALLTYRSVQAAPEGARERVSWRTSVWQWFGGRWRLRFHQRSSEVDVA